eukprot:COSAG01_NODE_13255_length_1611_cov_2.878307_2_plen_71_part_00
MVAWRRRGVDALPASVVRTAPDVRCEGTGYAALALAVSCCFVGLGCGLPLLLCVRVRRRLTAGCVESRRG